jgi:hypothetical protein
MITIDYIYEESELQNQPVPGGVNVLLQLRESYHRLSIISRVYVGCSGVNAPRITAVQI